MCIRDRYKGKKAEKFVVSKDGGDGEQIDAISGATITSRAVTGAVNVAPVSYTHLIPSQDRSLLMH